MRMNILYQFNELYVPYAGVSMTSLFENNKDIEHIKVYILEENICAESKKRLKECASKYNREIVFFDTSVLVKFMKLVGIPSYRDSYATNMKMFIPQFLSSDVDRLLYIDSDTIIESSLRPLYEMDLKENVIAMGLDSLGGRHKLYVGLSKKDDYYNAGIILYDMKKWCEEKWTDRIIGHVKNVRAHYMSPDQDLLNVVLKNHIKKFDLRYNLQPTHMVYSEKLMQTFFPQINYYSFDEICDAVKNPVILHTFRFLGEFPWHLNSHHPAVYEFNKYMKKSVWNDYEKQVSNQNGIVFKMERILYQYLPKSLFLILFKISFEIFIYKAFKASKKRKNISEM